MEKNQNRFSKGLNFFWVIIITAMMLLGCGDDGEDGTDGTDGTNGVCVESPRLKSGLFLDSAVQGLSYVSGSLSGSTDQDGLYAYEEGTTVTFRIGDIVIGDNVSVKATMTPLDLVPGAQSYKDATVTNILRFLQTIDDDLNPDNGILLQEEIGKNESLDFTLSQEEFADAAESLIDRIFPDQRDLVSAEDAQQHFRLTLLNIPGSDIDLEMRQLISETVETYDIPGAVMVIVTPDGLEWTGRSGVSDVINDTSLTISTKFRSGSVTKSFTGMTIAQLVQEGVLSLDDSLETWLPGVVPSPTPQEDASGEYTGYNANHITIRNLLHHTSGLFSFTDDMGFLMSYYTEPETQMTPQELVDIAVSYSPLSYPENPEFHYSNTNYVLLGMIIEEATGNSWESEVRRRFTEPLGLYDTIVPETGETVMPDRYSHGYVDLHEDTGGVIGEENILVDYSVLDPSLTWASGNIISTPADMAQWIRAVAEGELLDAENQNMMMTDMYLMETAPIEYGYGITENLSYGLIGHKGHIIGYDSAMQYHQETRTVIAVTSNRNLPGGESVQNVILLEALDILLDRTDS
ncbi:serine hydrolase domain-containing protein [Desulfobacterales bacterium HSG2]|nr:serine hydrolase domain-containing protein [Desulfobacterales bacterium HSG2]